MSVAAATISTRQPCMFEHILIFVLPRAQGQREHEETAELGWRTADVRCGSLDERANIIGNCDFGATKCENVEKRLLCHTKLNIIEHLKVISCAFGTVLHWSKCSTWRAHPKPTQNYSSRL